MAIGNKFLLHFQPILIQDLSLANSSDDGLENGNDSRRILRIQDKDKNTLVLLASSVSDCNLWLKEIDHAKKAYEIVRTPMIHRPKSSKCPHFQSFLTPFCFVRFYYNYFVRVFKIILLVLLFHCMVKVFVCLLYVCVCVLLLCVTRFLRVCRKYGGSNLWTFTRTCTKGQTLH